MWFVVYMIGEWVDVLFGVVGMRFVGIVDWFFLFVFVLSVKVLGKFILGWIRVCVE